MSFTLKTKQNKTKNRVSQKISNGSDFKIPHKLEQMNTFKLFQTDKVF